MTLPTDRASDERRPLTPVALAVTFATLVSFAPPRPVHAADDDTGASAGDTTIDIVVTARRREERLQDVPLTVVVLTSAALESTGTLNVGQLAQLEPTVQFYSSNPRNSSLTIRGLGSPFGLTNDGIEPGVGLYVDQVYYSRPAATTFDFLDVDQVEVLRGPQGTLYGKNTTAGAINVTSLKPSFTPEAGAEVSYGNYDYVQAKESLTGPLIGDTLAGRVATSYTVRDGTIYDVTTSKWINEEYNAGVKAQLLLHASDTLESTLFADYSYQNPLGFGQLYVRTGLTQRPLSRQFAALAAASGYAPPSLDPFDRVTDLDATLRATQRFGGASLLTEWKLGHGTLTFVTAWRYWGWESASDRDFTGLSITPISQNPSTQRQWTQEVRYHGSSASLDYVVGVFGYHQSIVSSGLQEQGPYASLWLLSGANASNPAILNGLRSTNAISLGNTSAAVFGQLTWHISDALRLQPGLRFNHDSKNGSYTATVTNATDTPLTTAQLSVLAPQSYHPRFSDNNVSGDLTASYTVTPDVLGYATYAHSFKSGGINLSGLPLDANNQPITAAETVKPEKVNHYETGLKTQLLEHRVTANLAAFWTDIRDFQATVTNSQVNVIRGYLANANKVRSRGLELDAAARPSERLSLYLNGAFTDARYVSFPDAPCPPELSGGTTATAAHPASPPGIPGGYSPASCDISGQWLPGVSRWALSYGIEYDLPLSLHLLGRISSYVAFDGSYRSEFSSNPSRSIYTDVSGYALANFRAGLRTDRWDVYGWVHNAFNRDYLEFLATQSGNTGLIVGQPGDPRTYGVTVRLSLR
jgi:iron complex outermembrane receptor protein